MTAAANEQCNGCRFWLADPNSPEWDDEPHARGQCRRYPPTISDHMAAIALGTPSSGQRVDPEEMTDTCSVYEACLLPVTFCTDWCGEFQATASRSS